MNDRQDDAVLYGKKSFHYSLDSIDEIDMLSRAMSSPVRLQILKLLIIHSMTMTELSQKLYVSMSSVSMHTKILKDAGLIMISPKPGMHGAQKVCGIRVERITFDFFAFTKEHSVMPTKIINVPVGSYSEANIVNPCGLVSNEDYVDVEDTQFGFYDPGHINAQLIWFTSGYLKYNITNKHMWEEKVKSVTISFEVCAEAPGFNNAWPSDIYLKINNEKVADFRVKGDYGGVRGLLNPEWWADSHTQYGELKILAITEEGTYLNGNLASKNTISSLKLKENYYFSFALGVDKEAEYPGGLNLFGSSFGNYAQGIRVEIQYN